MKFTFFRGIVVSFKSAYIRGMAERPFPFCMPGKELMKTAKLTKKMQEAARLLAMGLSVREVALRVRRTENTILGWMDESLFMDHYRQRVLQSQVVNYARAVERIGAMLEDENPSVVQRAAHEALEQFEDAAMRAGAQEMRILVEGMPDIGMPPEVDDEKSR